MSKIIINVYGGVVQDVFANDEELEVILIDHDNPSVGKYPVTLANDAKLDEIQKEFKDDYA